MPNTNETTTDFNSMERIRIRLNGGSLSAALVDASQEHGLGCTAYEVDGILQEPAIHPFLAWSILPDRSRFDSFLRNTCPLVPRYFNGALVKLSDFEKLVKEAKED